MRGKLLMLLGKRKIHLYIEDPATITTIAWRLPRVNSGIKGRAFDTTESS
jgi:hypothetical protein